MIMKQHGCPRFRLPGSGLPRRRGEAKPDLRFKISKSPAGLVAIKVRVNLEEEAKPNPTLGSKYRKALPGWIIITGFGYPAFAIQDRVKTRPWVQYIEKPCRAGLL